MRVVEATPDLISVLLDRMGPARVAALAKRAGGDPAKGIAANIAHSGMTWAGFDSRGVVVMGGVLEDGYVWQFLADLTGGMAKRGYLAMSRAMMAKGARRFPRLHTVIEASYGAALRHCARNGWTIQAPEEIGGVMACRCTFEGSQ